MMMMMMMMKRMEKRRKRGKKEEIALSFPNTYPLSTLGHTIALLACVNS